MIRRIVLAAALAALFAFGAGSQARAADTYDRISLGIDLLASAYRPIVPSPSGTYLALLDEKADKLHLVTVADFPGDAAATELSIPSACAASFSSDESLLYVATRVGKVAVVNVASKTVSATHDLNTLGVSLTPYSTALWADSTLILAGNGPVTLLSSDGATATTLGALGDSVGWLVRANETSGHVFFGGAASGQPRMAKYSYDGTATFTKASADAGASVGKTINSFRVSSDGRYAYASQTNTLKALQFDMQLSTPTVTEKFDTTTECNAVGLNDSAGYLYAGTRWSEVNKFQVTTGTEIEEYTFASIASEFGSTPRLADGGVALAGSKVFALISRGNDYVYDLYLLAGGDSGKTDPAPVPGGKSTVWGHCYTDDNQNGQYDPGEGIENVTVTMTGAGSDVTDANGYYLIEASQAGSYTIAAKGGPIDADALVVVSSDVGSRMDFTPQGAVAGGSGDVSFVLRWTYSAEPQGPDLDLFVIDPKGQKLSNSRDGFSLGPTPEGGRIDADDQGATGPGNGGGPERAFWPDGKAPLGTYTFGVKWYTGSGNASYTMYVYRGAELIAIYLGELSETITEAITVGSYNNSTGTLTGDYITAEEIRPTLDITSPATGTTVHQPSTITLSGTVESKIDVLYVLVGGKVATNTSTSETSPYATWTAQVPVAYGGNTLKGEVYTRFAHYSDLDSIVVEVMNPSPGDGGDTGTTGSGGGTVENLYLGGQEKTQSVYATTETLPLLLQVPEGTSATGGTQVLDVYLALVLPNGEYACLKSNLQFAEANTPTSFFNAWGRKETNTLLTTYSLAGVPPGTYMWAVLLVEAGGDPFSAADLVDIATSTFIIQAAAGREK